LKNAAFMLNLNVWVVVTLGRKREG
jgi:hypothetical protein